MEHKRTNPNDSARPMLSPDLSELIASLLQALQERGCTAEMVPDDPAWEPQPSVL